MPPRERRVNWMQAARAFCWRPPYDCSVCVLVLFLLHATASGVLQVQFWKGWGELNQQDSFAGGFFSLSRRSTELFFLPSFSPDGTISQPIMISPHNFWRTLLLFSDYYCSFEPVNIPPPTSGVLYISAILERKRWAESSWQFRGGLCSFRGVSLTYL